MRKNIRKKIARAGLCLLCTAAVVFSSMPDICRVAEADEEEPGYIEREIGADAETNQKADAETNQKNDAQTEEKSFG
ncbi:MAG: hypothetical protein NC489_46205 [Ruminococcus flavefaciens]|nr:hypothetical protein [Ruminococcus flavefaciens]